MKVGRRSRMGFSLMETILGMLVLALSAAGSFEALRLSDLNLRHALINNRITELLRESGDYVMYVAYDLLPADGAVLSQGSLYRFYDSTTHTWRSFYSYTVTASVLALNEGTASETRNITLRLTYQIEGRSPSSQLNSQTILSDAITRWKS